MVRLAASLLALLVLVLPAWAGDRAGIGFIGYSDDARYFAFEEFGIQDGSGFAYANVYVLDLQTDQWVKNTPVRVRLEDESSTLAAARADALSQARPVLDTLGIAEPVDIIALNGDGAAGINDKMLRFGQPGYSMAAPEASYELTLSGVAATLSMADCVGETDAGEAGFALNLTVDGKAHEVYRDKTVPESRGCPLGYRLYGVITPFDDLAAFAPELGPGALAIVSVYSLGFEGADRRFIAVPLKF
ncbi:putative secreted protein [Devosia sp. UYZn731]|uniref:DUF2259 domain-containing protein n=1 Tax=Devosia sp. UYZn731 TaxID=3156345 RepID=UPI00339623EC